jgi:hypothetical protein
VEFVFPDAICTWLEVEESAVEANLLLDTKSLATSVEDALLGKDALAAKA